MPPPQFIGRYEIVGSIGSGGMGTLLRARDPKIGGRTVAIKLLKEGLDNEEIRRRFMQEANAAGVLEHENIVRIFDVGEQGGEPFIAMEYIDGETLSAWIRRREPAPLTRKLRLIEELCDGLAYAHTFGIVHRDIKPANLMVEKRRGRLKILDFGIAKLADSGITNAGALIGSFNYMSPEQVRGMPIDHRSDIFSVGAVLFELLCYKQAFPGGLGDGVLGRIAEQPAPRLADALPDADHDLGLVIAKALEKDPARRYQDLNELHRDLSRVRRRFERDESSEHTLMDRMPEGRVAHQPTPVSTPRPTPRPARPAPEADRLARIRAQQIEEHLAAGRRAFEAGQLEEAIELTYRASAVDEQDARSHELRDQVQAALDERESRRLRGEARAALARGDLDQADALLARSREAKPDHTELGEIGQEISRARNQQAAALALQRARSSLGGQDWTAAIRASAEAEAYVPGLEEAREIRRRAQAALEEQRRIEAHDQAARHVTVEARQQVAYGDLAGAVARLAAFAPPHPQVTRELDRLRAELAAAEERAARERERQDRVRHEVEAARRAIVHGALDQARAHAAAAARDGAEPRLIENLRAEIDLARQHAEAQARRQAQVQSLVTEAEAKFAAGEFRGAVVRCEAALRVQPDDPRALDLRQRAHRAHEAQEQQRRRDAEAAQRRQEAEDAERRRQAEEARLRQEAEEARRLREAHDRAAQESIAIARREFDAGHHREAINRLASFSPLHDDVSAAAAALRAELTALEAGAQAAVTEARALFAGGRHDEAFARLDAVPPAFLPFVSRAREALEVEARRLAEAAERARRSAEEARRVEDERGARVARIAALADSARELAGAGRLDEALAAIGEAARLDPSSAELAELTRSIRAARAEREAAERRAHEIAATLADAESRLAAGDLRGARTRLDDVRRLDRQHDAGAFEARLHAAEAADLAAREAQRQAAEADRQGREREAQVDALLKKAKKAKKPHDAIPLLEDALRIDPAHVEARSLLEARQADIAQAEQARVAELQARAEAQARAEEQKARAAEAKTRAAAEKARAAEEKARAKRAFAAPGPAPAAAEGAEARGVVPARVPARPVPVPMLAAAAVVLLLVIGGALYYLMRPGPGDTQGQTGTTTTTTTTPTPGPNDDDGPGPVTVQPKAPVVTTAGLAPVSIDATPWARVTITPASGGAPVSCTTPCAVQLAAGAYVLGFENGGLSRPLTDRIVVAEGRPLDLRKTMPGFDADRAVASILGASQP